jgi:hypothetical protein
MRSGGNQNLYDYFDSYDLNHENIKYKYRTVSADYYKKRLDASSKNNFYE